MFYPRTYTLNRDLGSRARGNERVLLRAACTCTFPRVLLFLSSSKRQLLHLCGSARACVCLPKYEYTFVRVCAREVYTDDVVKS